MQDEKSFAGKLLKKLDASPEILAGHCVEIRGRESMRVTGLTKILLYAPCEIRVALADSTLSVTGKDLLCVAYSKTEIDIEGRIDSVIFKEQG